MSYTMDKLQYLLETKTEIRNAIAKKGQPISGNDTFRSYAEKIMAIEAGVKDPVLKIASGQIKPLNNDPVIVTHDLGVLPDVVTVFLCAVDENTTISYDTNCFGGEIAYSDEAIADGAQRKLYNSKGGSIGTNFGIHWKRDATTDALGCVREASTRKFTWGGSANWPFLVGATYHWVAIGGIKSHPVYLDVTLELDGEGGLIVHGGAPEISQLEIYVDGTLAKTVDYVHGGDLLVDISDVAAEVKEYTISVKAIGDGLEAAYKYQFFDSVTGWVLPKARGTCGENVVWLLDNDGKLTIKGSGAMTDYSGYSEVKPWASYKSSIQAVEVRAGVTRIGNYSFYNALNEYPNLKTLTIQDGVEAIGNNAFQNAVITSLKLPKSIRYIGNQAFMNCKSLTNLIFEEGITTTGVDQSFRSCTALTSVRIPGSVEEIGSSSFSGCTALADVTIEEGVGSIGASAFSQKCVFTSIVIPDSVTSIGNSAFNYSEKLTSVTIGSGVTSMGTNVFANCRALTSAVFKNTSGWWVTTDSSATSGTSVVVTSATIAATRLNSTHVSKYWRRS